MRKTKREKVKGACWVKPWILQRPEQGACISLSTKLEKEGAQQFRTFVRMNAIEGQHIIELVGPIIAKQNKQIRETISDYERVCSHKDIWLQVTMK